MFKKVLSSALGALRKGTTIDSQLGKFPITQEIGAAALASTTAVHAAITLGTGLVTTVTTAITNPDVLRAITITGNAAGIVGNVVITGIDWAGRTIVETIVANGVATVSGNVAFKTVSKITVPARNAGGNTIAIGTSTKLGLYRDINVAGDVLVITVGGVREAPATVNVANGTVITTTAQDGAKIFAVNYLTSSF